MMLRPPSGMPRLNSTQRSGTLQSSATTSRPSELALSSSATSRDAARDQVDKLGGQRATIVINAADDWDRLSLDTRRALICATVERAVVDTQGRGADRISVELFGE